MVVYDGDLGPGRRHEGHVFAAQGRAGEKFRHELEQVQIGKILEYGQPDLAVVYAGLGGDVAETADGAGQHGDEQRRAVNHFAIVRFDFKQRRLVVLQGLDAREEIGQRAEAGFLLDGDVADGFGHDAGGDGVDEIAVVGPGDVDLRRLAVLEHGDGRFGVQGDAQGPGQVVDRPQGDEPEVDRAVGLGQAVDGFVQRAVAAHGKYGVESGQGRFLRPGRGVAGFLRLSQLYGIKHCLQLRFQRVLVIFGPFPAGRRVDDQHTPFQSTFPSMLLKYAVAVGCNNVLLL